MNLTSSPAFANDPDYSAFTRERLQDPYPLLHRLRMEDPVHWCEPMKLWLVTRYDDVFAGLRDPRLSSNRTEMYAQALPPELKRKVQPLLDHLSKWLQLTDDPDHGRLRKLVNQAFSPKVLSSLRPRMESLTSEFLERLPQDEPFDILEQFCAPLPATVICELIGIPGEERDDFRRYTERVAGFSTRGGPALQEHATDACEALEKLVGMFERLVEDKRRTPQDDLLSALVSADADGERLSNDELYAMCVFLFFAGHETTTHGIASGLLTFLRNPAEWEKLKSNPEAFAPKAVEEVLRYESPVPRAVRRTREPVTLRGKEIPQGAIIIFLLSAANRDPEVFSDPDRFHIERDPNKHLAFGFGQHFCLGAMLARMEMVAAFRILASRYPGMRLGEGTLEWKPVMGIRGLHALPVKLAAAPTSR